MLSAFFHESARFSTCNEYKWESSYNGCHGIGGKEEYSNSPKDKQVLIVVIILSQRLKH